MKKTLWKLAASAALLGGTFAAQAGTAVGQWTAGAGLMWTQADADRRLDDNYGFAYEVGYALSENWDATLNAFSGNHDEIGKSWNHEIKGLTFDFDRVFNRSAGFSPFLLIGAGVVDQTHTKVNLVHQDKEVVGKLGVGMLADLVAWNGGQNGAKLQLKGTLAARGSVGRGIIDAVATLGLQVAFGSGSK